MRENVRNFRVFRRKKVRRRSTDERKCAKLQGFQILDVCGMCLFQFDNCKMIFYWHALVAFLVSYSTNNSSLNSLLYSSDLQGVCGSMQGSCLFWADQTPKFVMADYCAVALTGLLDGDSMSAATANPTCTLQSPLC